MSTQSIPGFYGKLPVVGDFVSRRLSREFITPWDQWLQSSMAASREQLSQQWLNSYLTSPLWRFVLGPGLFGQSGWMGILMPSVDKVGRYFPLTLALAVPDNTDVPALFTANNDWFSKLESAALSALEDNLDLNDLENLLKQISSPIIDPVLKHQALPYLDSGKRAVFMETRSFQSVDDALLKLNSELLAIVAAEQAFMPGQTFWGTLGSEQLNPFVLVSQGLPPVHAFSGFMVGDLSTRGWNLEKKIIDCQSNQGCGIPLILPVPGNDDQSDNPSSEDESTKPSGQWQSFSRTDVGKRRKCNEDAVLDKPEGGIWVVADGMGGHQAGDIASNMIVKALDELMLSSALDEAIRQVRQCLKQVNDDLRDLAESRFNRQIVGSTVVVMLANGRQAVYLWAGDSRLYLLRDGCLKQLTIDHSDGQDDESALLSIGSSLKKSNVITRAVGADDELILDCETIEIIKGDTYLLSSDGLDKEVSIDEIEKILNDNDCRNSVNSLIDLALERDARDNVSVIVVKV
jgi:type VI secretion system protein ImpM